MSTWLRKKFPVTASHSKSKLCSLENLDGIEVNVLLKCVRRLQKYNKTTDGVFLLLNNFLQKPYLQQTCILKIQDLWGGVVEAGPRKPLQLYNKRIFLKKT